MRLRLTRSHERPPQKMGKYKKSSSQLADAVYGDFSQTSIYNNSLLNSDKAKHHDSLNQDVIVFNQTERLNDLKYHVWELKSGHSAQKALSSRLNTSGKSKKMTQGDFLDRIHSNKKNSTSRNITNALGTQNIAYSQMQFGRTLSKRGLNSSSPKKLRTFQSPNASKLEFKILHSSNLENDKQRPSKLSDNMQIEEPGDDSMPFNIH